MDAIAVDPHPVPVAVFAPTTQMSVTLECTSGVDEVHVHAAAQGFWVARMLTVLGHEPHLCTPIGGETGTALRALLGDLPTDGLVPAPTPNGAYIHDRRSGGERRVLAHVATPPLDRHTVDDLVSATLACALRAGHIVVTGTNLDGNIEPATFRRMCRDLRGAGVGVVADLSGEELAAALEGGVDLVKISHEELIADGFSAGDSLDELVDGVRKLQSAGADDVVVSRAGAGALAAIGGQWWTFRGPQMTVIEHRGAGDSMTAVLAHGRVSDLPVQRTLRLAAAASALNVTRHGLASGHRGAILELAELVTVEQLDV
jgi:1-phosphofructokinase